MSNETPDARTRAVRLIEKVLADRAEKSGVAATSSATDLASVVDAIEIDLIAADQANTDIKTES
jgi:hypothetical protein